MRYSKEDAQMTQGLAVLCMVILHLFCRTGADVLGMPLIWLNSLTPLVYWFGFFAEICVPIYSIWLVHMFATVVFFGDLCWQCGIQFRC